MDSVLTNRLKITLLALGLSAAAAPAAAVTNITSCSEINQPGSYRVIQNLSHLGSKGTPQCLLINASDVTIDLQGHAITGDGSPVSVGIATGPNLSNIAIHDGTVAFFGSGIELGGRRGLVRGTRVERIGVFDNSSFGISVGSDSVVVSNIVKRNGHGIVVNQSDAGSLIVDNVVSENVSTGVLVKTSVSAIRGNVITDNGGSGIDVLCPSLVSGNTAVGNLKNNPPSVVTDLFLRGFGCLSRDNLAGGVK